MVPSGARAGVPFPQASEAASEPSLDQRVPRSAASESRASEEADDRPGMDVDMGETTPTKRAAGSANLPSIKNLFGIERADDLRNMRQSPSQGEGFTPGSPSNARSILSPSARTDRSPYGHGSSNSFSSLSGTSSSSLGLMRHRQTSTTGSLGRAGAPGTPPRQGMLPQMLTSEEAGRRRTESRSRQSLKGLLMSPPTRRGFLDGDSFGDSSTTPRKHRPGSSAGSAPMPQHLPGPEHLARASSRHAATLSDPSPGLLPTYAPSSYASVESSNPDAWGSTSTQSESTSPRTSWHSRSSTLESGESSHKMAMGEGMQDRQPPLLPAFREPGQAALDLLGRSPEETIASLTRHGSLRNPQVSGGGSAMRRPRARTLTFSDRPIAPLPGTSDPARRQHLEAASELLRMGRGVPPPQPLAPPSGRFYHHKYSFSMQERTPLSLELYTSEQVDTRGHRPKSSSMSAQGPPVPQGAPYQSGMQFERPELANRPFDSFHPRRGRGAADEAMRPGANFVFPRRPMPDSAEAQRYQAHLRRGQGLASVPDGIVSGAAGGPSDSAGSSGTIASGQAKYECAWCGKRFSRPSSLKIHHHSHTGEKPFVCSEPGCGRSFSVQSNLRRHQKCHAPGNEDNEQAGRSHISHSASSSRTDEPEIWLGGSMHSNRMASPLEHHTSASCHHPQQPHQQQHLQQHQQQPHQHQFQHQQHPSYGTLQQIKDHPPLSRSAFEPGSRSMGSWAEVQQHQMHEQLGAGLEPPFMQIRERRLSESSGEEEEGDEGPQRTGNLLVKDSPRQCHSPRQDTASSLRIPPSALSSDEEDRPPTSRMRSGTSGSTSGIRVGFSSLLNPTVKSSIDEKE